MTLKEQQLLQRGRQTHLWPEVVGGQNVFVLSPRSPPGVVKFKTPVAEVWLAVGAALGGLQRLRGLTEAAHDGDAAQAQRVSVPEGCTWVQGDKCRGRNKKRFKHRKKVVIFIPGLDTSAAACDVTLSCQRKANCCTALYRHWNTAALCVQLLKEHFPSLNPWLFRLSLNWQTVNPKQNKVRRVSLCLVSADLSTIRSRVRLRRQSVRPFSPSATSCRHEGHGKSMGGGAASFRLRPGYVPHADERTQKKVG